MSGFDSLYADWINSSKRDATIRKRLRDTYRNAWQAGDSEERYCVLMFIWDDRISEATDLLFEAMHSDDADLAVEGAIIAYSFTYHGVDLGTEGTAAFRQYNQRFPEKAFPEHIRD